MSGCHHSETFTKTRVLFFVGGAFLPFINRVRDGALIAEFAIQVFTWTDVASVIPPGRTYTSEG
jgi:hypothetical protein